MIANDYTDNKQFNDNPFKAFSNHVTKLISLLALIDHLSRKSTNKTVVLRTGKLFVLILVFCTLVPLE